MTNAIPISDRAYWERQYERARPTTLHVDGFANRPTRLLLEKLLPHVERASTIIEVGAGGSQWLPYLADRFPAKQFIGLDYADAGIASLRASGMRAVKADMFEPPSELLGRADLVISFGVVEHFRDLPATLRAIARFATPTGVMFTQIPNLSGVMGPMVRALDRSVWDIHVPHDLGCFVAGHDAAGLDVLDAGYLCSSNFGVLSSTVPASGPRFELFKLLTRVSKAGWWLEERFGALPATRLLAPFIYAASVQRRRWNGAGTAAR